MIKHNVIITVMIMIILVAPNLATIQNVDGANVEPTSDALDKIENRLRAILDNSSEEDRMNVLVVCEGLDTSTYTNQVRDSIADMHITDIWDALGAFSANVSKSQLLKLAELPYVISIDSEEGEIIFELDDACSETDVDKWRDEYPYINGDLDGELVSYSKDDVVIAIIDTGCDNDHVDLAGGKLLAFKDCTNEANSDYTPPIEAYDPVGHGTHVCSIAAGLGIGSYGLYQGVAPLAALVVVRIGLISELTDALNWIAAYKGTYGIEIVSMSLSVPGSDGDYDAYAQLADRLVYDYGLIVICAQGNTDKGPIVRSPGTGKFVITVGNAIDPSESSSGNWELNPTSCSGPVDDGRKKPDVLAPGTNIMAAEAGTLNQYIPGTGTSMSTPFVAGFCALWLDENMGLKAPSYGLISDPKVKNLLMASATDMPYDTEPGKDNSYGAGRIDAWDELLFYITDISGSYFNAPTVITKSWSDKNYYHDNEPLWAGDPSSMADWYKIFCYDSIFIYAKASGDPDLVLIVSIWDKNLVKKAESYYGRIRNVGYWSTYEGTYYVKVEVYKNGNLYRGQVSGDFYDVHIMTTVS